MSDPNLPPTPTTPTAPKMELKLKHMRTRPRRQHITPEEGSLYDLLHDHAFTSLFILPICWTDHHIQLLGCQFTQLPPQKTPTPMQLHSPPRSKRTPPTVLTLAQDLNTIVHHEVGTSVGARNRALKNIFSTLFPTHLTKAKTCTDLSIRFGRRCYLKAVRCQAIWKHPDSATMSFDSATTCSDQSSQLTTPITPTAGNDFPILTYISRSHLNHVRRNCYRILPGPNRLFNAPVHRLQALRSKLLMPKNQDEDQYILAVMIALAQESAYSALDFNPKDTKIRVFTASEEDESFIVYTGTVPAALLRMFHQPEKAPQGNTDIRIDYTQVPIWPVLGLKERLGQALGRDVVGDFDATNMETFESELPPTPETPLPKRRRDVLAEVFNASFSEDRDSDSPVEAIGKRRCLEEGRVGLVR